MSVTVIVRAKDSGATIDACLRSIREQSVPIDLVLVDSGSTDDTLSIAEAWQSRIIHLKASDFTFGGALNLGAEAAVSDVHVALSSHCTFPDVDWVARARANVLVGAVGATTGKTHGPAGEALSRPLTVDSIQLGRYSDPYWSFSNHASAWRAEVWRDAPFDESIEACEDTEWSDRIARAGWKVCYDPSLVVTAHHRTTGGLRSYIFRRKREMLAIQKCRDLQVTYRDVLERHFFSQHEGSSKARHILGKYRIIGTLAELSLVRERRRGLV